MFESQIRSRGFKVHPPIHDQYSKAQLRSAAVRRMMKDVVIHFKTLVL